MGAPPNPQDGVRYSELLLGVPAVLEYDGDTGGFKMVVATEGALEVSITGATVQVDAVRIRDGVNPALMAEVDSAGSLHVSLQSGSVNVAPGSYVNVTGSVQLLESDNPIGAVEIKNALTDDRAIVDGVGGLQTAWPSGSVGIDGSIPLPDSGWTPPLVGAAGIMWNDAGGVWRRMQGLDYGDGVGVGESFSLLGVSSFLNLPQENPTTSSTALNRPRIWATRNELFKPSAVGGITTVATLWARDTHEGSGSYGAGGVHSQQSRQLAMDGKQGRLHTRAFVTGSVSIEGLVEVTGSLEANLTPGSYVNITGTVDVRGMVDTELPAAAALSDAFANPTAPAVGAFGMSYDPTVAGGWVRNKAFYIQTSGRGSIPYTDVTPTIHVESTLLGFESAGASLAHILSIDNALSVSMASGTSAPRQPKDIIRDIVSITGSAGQNQLIAGVGGQSIRVMSMMLISSSDTDIQFMSGFSGTFKTGPMSLPVDGDGFFLPPPATPDLFHFETDAGDGLVMQDDGGGQVGGWINYYTE